MKLHYFHGRSPLRALVMSRGGHRLELFIKPVGEQAWALVALTGPEAGQPDRQHCQGPWNTLARAESMFRSTAGALMGNGYEPCPADYVVWSLTAQRLARTIRTDQPPGSHPGALHPDQFEPLT